MKIYLRYPIPKSLSSGKGLTIASLKVLVVISFIVFNQFIWGECILGMKLYAVP